MDVERDRSRYQADRKKDVVLSGTLGIDAALKAHQLDALLFPGASRRVDCGEARLSVGDRPLRTGVQHSDAAVSTGFGARQAPFGVTFTGTACSEPRLIALAFAFEQATRRRVPPHDRCGRALLGVARLRAGRAYRQQQHIDDAGGDGRRRAASCPGRGRRRPVHPRPARRRPAGNARRGGVGPGRSGRLRPRHARPLPPRPRDRRRPRAAISRKDVEITAAGERPVPPSGRRRPASTTSSCGNWRSWAAASRRSTASRATSSGRGPTGASGCCRPGRSPRPTPPSAQSPPRGDRRPAGARRAGRHRLGGSTSPRSCPQPTPMTWAIVRRFMSGRGGFGLMYRDLGFDPDPALDELGYFDLVCGRPYCNLSREPRCTFAASPRPRLRRAQGRPAEGAVSPAGGGSIAGGFSFVLRLPVYMFKMWRASARIKSATRTLAERLQSAALPTVRRRRGPRGTNRLAGADERAAPRAARSLDRGHAGRLRPRVAASRRPSRPRCWAARGGLAPRSARSKRRSRPGGCLSGVEPAAEADLAGAAARPGRRRDEPRRLPARLRPPRVARDGAGRAAVAARRRNNSGR